MNYSEYEPTLNKKARAAKKRKGAKGKMTGLDRKYKQMRRAPLFSFYFLTSMAILSLILFIVVPPRRPFFLLEMTITGMAAFVYYHILQHVNQKNIDWRSIIDLRYLDWTFTTPIMLVSLMLLLSNSVSELPKDKFVGSVVLLDIIMIWAGYLGEIGVVNRFYAWVIGFVALFMIMCAFFKHFEIGQSSLFQKGLYFVYFGVWTLYGIIYNMEPVLKTTIIGYLDAFAKSFLLLAVFFSLLVYSK